MRPSDIELAESSTSDRSRTPPKQDLDKLKASKTDGSSNASDTEGFTVEPVPPAGFIVDDVFGEISDDKVNYRNVGWIATFALLCKTQIGLGVLTIPSILLTLGAVPGVIVVCAIATITTWSGYVIGTFKKNHPEVYSVSDIGYILAGPIGREIIGWAGWLLQMLCAASGILGLSIALNAVSMHGTCTAVFVAVAAVAAGCLASFPTLQKVSWLSWVGLVSVLTSVFVLTIAVGVEDRPSEAPQTGPWDKNLQIAAKPNFIEAMVSISNVMLSYAGSAGYVPILAEMREPRKYSRALFMCQGLVTAVYLAIGIVVYYFCGQYVASPALGSAGVLMKRICYGLAIPGLMATSLLYTHLPAKWAFVRMFRGTETLTANDFKHWAWWLASVWVTLAAAYVAASAIPVFDGLIGLIGAMFGSFLGMQLMSWMWVYDNLYRFKARKTPGFILMLCWVSFVFVVGCFITGAGTYGSVMSIKLSYEDGGSTSAWQCADNSNSV